MKEIKFSYAIPRKYETEEGEVRYALPKGGAKMDVGTLNEVRALVRQDMDKAGCPWMQIYSNGYRVTNDNENPAEWNGVTMVDFDSKHFYRNVRKFDVDKLKKAFADVASTAYPYYNNFYAIYKSYSNEGYRILFYWDCERTADNFKKCAILSEKYTKEICYMIGNDAKTIVDYKNGKEKTIDDCAKSSKQGIYVTLDEPVYSIMMDKSFFGECDIDDVQIRDTYKMAAIKKISSPQHDEVLNVTINDVDKDKIQYFPHVNRWCIYDALIVVYKDKVNVDEQWKRIADLIPEENGHTHSFYQKEPDRNKWYERFNDKVYHNISWLEIFGYDVEVADEYVFSRRFERNWQSYCLNKVITAFNNDAIEEIKATSKTDKQTKAAIEELYKDFIEQHPDIDVFDTLFDDIEDIETIRKEYYKQVWNPNEISKLIGNYTLGEDVDTYKMYADLVYRDNRMHSTVRYDCLEDTIEKYGFDKSTREYNKWVPINIDNEYADWCNYNKFTNKAIKQKMKDAIYQFIPMNHGYHIIRDYFNSIKDIEPNTELLETMFIRYQGIEDTQLNRLMTRNWMIAAVKKQLTDNPKDFTFPHILFLQGATGCGKTYMLTHLFNISGRSFILNKIDPNADDGKIGPMVEKNWLIQFGESENLKKVSVNAAKEFVDRINMGFKYQKKYENEQTTVYPRVVVCRTSNDDVLFNDISINDGGDRRNWLIVCNKPANSWNAEVEGKAFDSEIDILWSTAYHLYMENTDANLELPYELSKELADKQEDYKLVKNVDIEEVYSTIFDREYLINSKGQFESEKMFNIEVDNPGTLLVPAIDKQLGIDVKSFASGYQLSKLNRIPVSWLSNYVKNKYGINYMKLLKVFLENKGWENKPAGYGPSTMKCWCLTDKTTLF